MKINKKGMFGRILAIALAALSFVGMAFKFFGIKGLGATVTMGGWFDTIKLGAALKVDGIGWWQTAKVFMIITLVAVGILALVALVQFFVKSKMLNSVMKFVSIVCAIAALVFLLTFVVGCIGSDGYTLNAAAFVIGLSAVGASVTGFLSAKK